MNKILMAIVLSTAVIAVPVSAEPYVGLGAGSAKTDSNDTSYKAYAGYQFVPYFGVEVGYNSLGDYYSAKTESWTVAAVGTIPLGDTWELFGKAGDARNTTKFGGTHTKHSFLKGVGVGAKLSPDFSLRVEYEDFGKLPSLASGASDTATGWTVSVKHSF